MNMRQNRASSRSGQAFWMILSLISLFLFAGAIALVYMQMQYYHDEGMWEDKQPDLKGWFFKDAPNSSMRNQKWRPPERSQDNLGTGAGVTGNTGTDDAADTNAVEEVTPPSAN